MAKKKNRNKQQTSQTYLITREHRSELKQELQHLKTTARTKVAHKIKEIRLLGNLSNNSAYDDAKNEQRKIESRISEIEEVLAGAKIIDEDIVLELETIIVGSKVKLHDLAYDEYMHCSIVNDSEVNSLQYKISAQSPLGKALIGKREGDTVTVETGSGPLRYKVLEIEGIDDKYIKNAIKKEPTVTNTILKRDAEIAEIRDISPQNFITRVTVWGCQNKEHVLVDIRCRIKIMTRSGRIEECIIPGAYCETCDKYFLLESEFQKLRQKGILVCKVVELDYWISSESRNGYMSLNKESLLHILGYNVNAQANLSQMQRWGLLEVIVDEKIMTITEIQSHLQWLIKKSMNNRNFEDARSKWELDYAHISQYNTSLKTIIDVKQINRIHYKKSGQ